MVIKQGRPSSSKEPTVAAGEFKAKCLGILDEVSRTRRGVLITKRGRPLARVVPIETADATAGLKGSLIYEGDLISPIGDLWSASS